MADVLRAPSLYDEHNSHTPESLRHSPTHRSPIYLGTPRSYSPPRSSSSSSADDASDRLDSYASSSPPSPQIGPYLSRVSSYHSTPPSSISLDTTNAIDDLDSNWLPSYTNVVSKKAAEPPPPPRQTLADLPLSPSPTPDDLATPTEDLEPQAALQPVKDDSAAKAEPSRQVDYLSHEWREEDIWSSWKHIVARRKVYGERSRLENASWRQWTKQKYDLKTVTPETLNWLKDCDVTWLYGPLKEAPIDRCASQSTSHLSKTNSFLSKKPILKKRSASEVMLQKSISSSSLIKEAAAVIQAQRRINDRGRPVTRPNLRRCISDLSAPAMAQLPPTSADLRSSFPSSSSSGVQSPDGTGRRHIRFDNKVEQCIAVDFKPDTETSNTALGWMRASSEEEEEEDDNDDDDDGYMPMLKAATKKHTTTPSSSRSSFSQDSKGIAMLPSTTLKFHHDDPDCQGHPPASPHFSSSWRPGGALSHSASQETLKPSKPSSNFLIEDDDEADMEWEPSGAFGNLKRDSIAVTRSEKSLDRDQYEEDGPGPGMRRTPSGMFMPYDENDEESFANTGVLGRLVDTVNTARDIATVVWNVGWRR